MKCPYCWGSLFESPHIDSIFCSNCDFDIKSTETDIRNLIRERKLKYGNNFSDIAREWSEHLGKDIHENDVAKMMSLLKMTRMHQDKSEDSKIDYFAYSWISENYEKYLEL